MFMVKSAMINKLWTVFLLFITLTLMLNSSVIAKDIISQDTGVETQEEDWDSDWDNDWNDAAPVSPWQFTGFVEAGYGEFLQHNSAQHSASLQEARARVELDYSHERFQLTSKIDGYYDGVLSKMLWQPRELNISASPASFVDIKAGKQILTWGTGDYLFLNDLFAKDWQSFFSGRADEYLKAPSTSLRSDWYLSNISLSLVWTPDFTADRYITGERFSFYSPQAQQIIAPVQAFAVEKTKKSQWAARVNTRINNIEISLYGYQGFWPIPEGTIAVINNNISQDVGYFPKLNSWGASASSPFYGGMLNAEYASYNSLEDSRGTNALIANGQHRYLIGYERELVKNFTLGLQYYIERTKHYQALLEHSANPAQVVAENRQLITMRLRYSALQQSLIYTMFSFYSPSDKDGYLKPSIEYQYNDQWRFSTGANLFFGQDDYSFFGQHQNNSNAWLRIRYQY